MAKSWYMVQTYTGYENKIEKTLHLKLESGELDPQYVTSILVPVEETITIKDGKKKTSKSKFLSGYIMLEMDLPDIGWKSICSTVRRIQGVNGFVGTDPNVRPRPISDDEARKILVRCGLIKGEKTIRITSDYKQGDAVKIHEGAFSEFTGTVDEVYADKNKLRVMVQVFGRATPVELEISQVEKIVQ